MGKRVLFLCTGNSARSQMAEAIVNARLGDSWFASSAGTHPADSINPYTFRALREIGIDHRGSPKHVDEMRDVPFDLVVTVCDSAAEECPLWLGPGIRVHLSFPDPTKVTGTDEERIGAFRLVRDDITAKIPPLLLEYLGAHAADKGWEGPGLVPPS